MQKDVCMCKMSGVELEYYSKEFAFQCLYLWHSLVTPVLEISFLLMLLM